MHPRDLGPGAPLEGVYEGIGLLAGLALLLISGLLFFFRPHTVLELRGDQLTADHVRLVTEHTTIVFPPDARLIGLCHQDKSMSARIATKFELPDHCREAFLQNAIFHAGIEGTPHYALGSRTSWWHRDHLKSRMDRVQYLPNGTYVECSMGLEDGRTVVYVSWA